MPVARASLELSRIAKKGLGVKETVATTLVQRVPRVRRATSGTHGARSRRERSCRAARDGARYTPERVSSSPSPTVSNTCSTKQRGEPAEAGPTSVAKSARQACPIRYWTGVFMSVWTSLCVSARL
jgi:hypothetical protein